MSIPENVQVHQPNDIRSKGKCKRILGHVDRNKMKQCLGLRKCTTCLNVGHDRRNCPKKNAATP
jgi:hypothetical protein